MSTLVSLFISFENFSKRSWYTALLRLKNGRKMHKEDVYTYISLYILMTFFFLLRCSLLKS